MCMYIWAPNGVKKNRKSEGDSVNVCDLRMVCIVKRKEDEHSMDVYVLSDMQRIHHCWLFLPAC
jgi:hypothetical protein